MTQVAVVVNVSSAERFFLHALVRECKLFASQIIFVYAPTRHSGAPEDLSYLVPFLADPFVTVVPYFVNLDTHNPLKQRPNAYWPNVARVTGAQRVNESIDWVLFLDADEVPEGARMLARLATLPPPTNHVWKVMNYWYFRDVTHQAHQWEATAVLVPRGLVDTPDKIASLLMVDDERFAFQYMLKCDTLLGDDNLPLLHHFSWVRPLDDLLKKVRSWSHQGERPWETLILQSWSRPFDGTDFVHGYTYTEVTNKFDININTTD